MHVHKFMYMKSRSAIATACHLFALPSSTLLVKYPSTTCKVLVVAFFFPDYLSMTSYRCPPHERPGSSGQTCLVAATSKSVRLARSLATRFQAGQPHLHVYLSAQMSGGGTRVHAVRWHAGRSLSLTPIRTWSNASIKDRKMTAMLSVHVSQ